MIINNFNISILGEVTIDDDLAVLPQDQVDMIAEIGVTMDELTEKYDQDDRYKDIRKRIENYISKFLILYQLSE